MEVGPLPPLPSASGADCPADDAAICEREDAFRFRFRVRFPSYTITAASINCNTQMCSSVIATQQVVWLCTTPIQPSKPQSETISRHEGGDDRRRQLGAGIGVRFQTAHVQERSESATCRWAIMPDDSNVVIKIVFKFVGGLAQ
jgi:hypothetical protein